MKLSKDFLIFIGIVLLGLILRMLFLDKAGGLWYDELLGSYNEAAQPNIFAVISYTMKNDIHFPLYQIFLHYWGNIFSFSDYSLRLFSVFCGSLNVIVAYFIGNDLKSRQTGLICAAVFAINSFLIYYSQEVRMYSFLVLLASCYLLFAVRTKNDYKNKVNYILFVLFAFALIMSYTISFIFVIAQFVILFIYLINEHKEDKRSILKHAIWSFFFLILFCLPIFIYFITHKAQYSGFMSGFFSNWTSFLVSVQDWF